MGRGMNEYYNRSKFREKDGSPYILGHHAKLYRRQDFKMCDNFVSFVQGRGFYTEGTACAKPSERWFLNLCA